METIALYDVAGAMQGYFNMPPSMRDPEEIEFWDKDSCRKDGLVWLVTYRRTDEWVRPVDVVTEYVSRVYRETDKRRLVGRPRNLSLYPDLMQAVLPPARLLK